MSWKTRYYQLLDSVQRRRRSQAGQPAGTSGPPGPVPPGAVPAGRPAAYGPCADTAVRSHAHATPGISAPRTPTPPRVQTPSARVRAPGASRVRKPRVRMPRAAPRAADGHHRVPALRRGMVRCYMCASLRRLPRLLPLHHGRRCCSGKSPGPYQKARKPHDRHHLGSPVPHRQPRMGNQVPHLRPHLGSPAHRLEIPDPPVSAPGRRDQGTRPEASPHLPLKGTSHA